MYTLLIVDDEPTVRMGLKSYFDWSTYGIEVVGEADDGDAALRVIRENTPDLVLTDVRMPNMDGITLSRHISTHFPRTKIIFVSGHDDADYLKSALKVRAVDYIFKPVNLQELSEVIRRVVKNLDVERAEQRLKEELQIKLKEGMPLLREKFLLSLITAGAPKSDLRDRIEFLGLVLPVQASYWVIVVSIDDLAEVTGSRSERDRQLLWYSVLNICQELVDRHFAGYVIEHHTGEFAGILHMDLQDGSTDAAEFLLKLAGSIRDSLHEWLHVSVTIGISEKVTDLAHLAQCYRQAREAADHKWFLGKNRIITMDSLEHPNGETMCRSHYDPDLHGRLISALRAADRDHALEILDQLFGSLNHNREGGLKYARSVCLQVVLSVGQLLFELNALTAELEAAEVRLWEVLFEKETLGEMRSLIEEHLTAVCDRICEKRNGKMANLVERVRAIIERRYAYGGLTVSEIGREVYLTPTYVSLLFKQETGQTINEYLTQVRVEKAKELLRDPKYKFYDICYAIGYTDPSYFTKLFKKATGVTPSAYRDSHG